MLVATNQSESRPEQIRAVEVARVPTPSQVTPMLGRAARVDGEHQAARPRAPVMPKSLCANRSATTAKDAVSGHTDNNGVDSRLDSHSFSYLAGLRRQRGAALPPRQRTRIASPHAWRSGRTGATSPLTAPACRGS
jgi:hypothetical protein